MSNVYRVKDGAAIWHVVALGFGEALSRLEGFDALANGNEGEAVSIARLSDEEEIRETLLDGPDAGQVKVWTAEDYAEANPEGLLCSEF